MLPDNFFEGERWHVKVAVVLELLCLLGTLFFLWMAIYKTDDIGTSLFLGVFSALYAALFVRLEEERRRVLAKRNSAT